VIKFLQAIGSVITHIVFGGLTTPYNSLFGKKKPQYSRLNFGKFKHSFLIFGMNHPDTSMY